MIIDEGTNEILKGVITSSSSAMASMADLPLQGLRVVELCQNVAGPYAASILGQLGARVVKVERPGEGDSTRAWVPPFWGHESVMFAVMNAGKEGVALDIDDPDDRQQLLNLIADSDVVIESFRPGALERRGLGAEQLRAAHPLLIYCSISGFGSSGPLASDPGYDPILQAFSGLMSLTGEPDARPVRVGTSVIDMGTGMWAALGVVTAVIARDRTGVGASITTSLLETGLAWIPYQIAAYLATGKVPERTGTGLPMIVPYQVFPTADRDLMLAAGNNALWVRLCSVMGREDLRDDPELATNSQRVERRGQVVDAMTTTLRTRPAAEWYEEFRAAGVPCAIIQDVAEAIEHPQVRSLEMLVPVPHPTIEGFTLTGLPLRFGNLRPKPGGPPPTIEGQA